MAFNEHPSTRGRLTGLRESRPVNLWQWCCDNKLAYSMILIELLIDDEKRSLPLCAYVADFGKSRQFGL